MLFIHLDVGADSWVPNSNDVFAEDRDIRVDDRELYRSCPWLDGFKASYAVFTHRTDSVNIDKLIFYSLPTDCAIRFTFPV